MKTLIIGILSSVALFCAASETAIHKDVAYVKSGDDYRLKSCKLDLQLPTGTGFSTVVWFHGGGLNSGAKHFPRLNPEIAIVAVDYRLMTEDNGVRGEDCIQDAAEAVAWTLDNIERYGGDKQKVYVSGMSAGGYLTMMVGMAPKYLAQFGHSNLELAGLIPISGQATKHFNVRKYAGDKDPQFAPKIDELAPLYWVSDKLPPILSVCGQPPYEWPCRSEENRFLISSCTALGHKNAKFVEMDYCDHGRAYDAGLPYLEFFIFGRMP